MNSSTGGTTKDGNKWGIVKGAKNALGGKYTPHNCYGVASENCANEGLLENNQPMGWEPVYQQQNNNQGASND